MLTRTYLKQFTLVTLLTNNLNLNKLSTKLIIQGCWR